MADTLHEGVWYPKGSTWTSNNGSCTLTFQEDGNLVATFEGKPYFQSATAQGQIGENAGWSLVLQQGILQIFAFGGRVVWARPDTTANAPGSRVVVQDDGNIVTYKPDNTPFWESRTSILETPGVNV